MLDGTPTTDDMRGSPAPIVGRCGSPLRKRPGRFCIKSPLKGKQKCRLHGGRSPSGIAHYNWKHGMYSGALKGLSLATHYDHARKNPAIVQNIEQIALVDARVFDLFDQLKAGESQSAWQRVREATERLDDAYGTLREAQRTKDIAAMMSSLDAIGTATEALRAATEAGTQGLATWDAITAQIYLRKKLVDSESRRQKDAQEMLSKERVMAIVGLVAQSVYRHVDNVQQRQGIVNDLRVLIAGHGGEAA